MLRKTEIGAKKKKKKVKNTRKKHQNIDFQTEKSEKSIKKIFS
jgi:hypothetical protein